MRASFTLVLALAATLGCSSSDDEPRRGGQQQEGGGGGTGGSSPGVGYTGPGSEVPPARYQTDANTCPVAFQDDGPHTGENPDFAVADQKRSLYVTKPDVGKFKGPRPVLVWFHDTGETGNSISAIEQELLDRGMYGIGLDANDNGKLWPTWDAMHDGGFEDSDPNPDLAFFDQAIDCLAAHNSVDGNRIYVAGFSAGGVMTNYVLGRRSKFVAGAVVGSGVFVLTQPVPAVPLDPFAVIVAWGGNNDHASAEAAGFELKNFDFTEQAALASSFYEAQEGVHQVACHGKEVGHSFLASAREWMLDFLLAHPKGLTVSDTKFEGPDASTNVVCSEDPPEYSPPHPVECPESSVSEHCQKSCQYTASCTVENPVIATSIGDQLSEIGFTGDDHRDCSQCVATCDQAVTDGGAIDADVAECLGAAGESDTCSFGVDGNAPWRKKLNTCCYQRTKSLLCKAYCEPILKNPLAASLIPACDAWKKE